MSAFSAEHLKRHLLGQPDKQGTFLGLETFNLLFGTGRSSFMGKRTG